MKTTQLAVLIAVMVFLVHCHSADREHPRITTCPEVDEIVGEYQLTETWLVGSDANFQGSLQELDTLPTIWVQSDGSLDAVNFPRFEMDNQLSRYVFIGFVSLTDRWCVDQVGATVSLDGITQPFFGIHLKSLKGEWSCAAFYGNDSIEGLVFQFGDPDVGEMLIFRKIITASSLR